ncbi:endonuclease [Candidatus Micrarchaeota archaeon CG_4_10_14_0_2_um_filter_55_9]|nr:MAG: hypothetical protein AUJ15_02595 [Candidatus Micrarchaeota archaeon CG1_02_55_41]PIO02609.1 MAG: endonuclease [Candidatus Micrarchaeota archaeon CG09_land_8_20_14_0_10_55_25]PIZ91502.1 MAG: endonuclease [Candidatus Micrarchaeota archaeon CG_4_10_14_0_2_um_filter_55_9]PJD01399.1 MAG: endonuclease [Candidatus Micrarchaeota archaeon CG10_big_fil_rev_8_21_14_0_10_54_18]
MNVPKRIFELLYAEFGPQKWWPARSRFEVMVGAVLTQNTSWKNVVKAVANLRQEKLLSPRALASCPLPRLRRLIKPSGYYNQKAIYLKGMARYIVKHYNGDLDRFFSQPTCALKHEVLSWKGVGPETRDSILLYAGGKPVFVVDAFTQRLARRYPLLGETYAQLQEFFESSLPRDAALYNEFHALIVELAKRNCFKGKPDCAHCPLNKECGKII